MGILDLFRVVDYVAGDECPHCGNKSLWNQVEKPPEESLIDKVKGTKSIWCDNCKRWFRVKKS